MLNESTDLSRFLFQGLAGLIVIAGAAVDIYLGVLVQTRRLLPSLPSRTPLTQRPFTAVHAQLALFATLMFALPMLFQKPATAAPSDLSLILCPVFYAATGFMVVSFCLTYSRTSFRQAFLSPDCAAGLAIKKGWLYGLAIIPPIVLLSMITTTVTEALGYEPKLQEVFDWLGDDTLALSTRVFMMAAAVIIAPVVEEALFRGILFPAVLKARSFFFAALLSGAYFAVVHFHAPSFLPLLALSIAFSAGYAATGSILTPIVMHSLFNLTSIIFYLADRG
jgi:membrane protease YdiL (CAAX protease family)